MFSCKFCFFLFNNNSDRFKHFFGLFLISFHDSSRHGDDGLHNELTETSNKGFVSCVRVFIFFPFFISGIIIVISPKFFHHFVNFNLEFYWIDLSKSSKSECPAIFSWSEGNITFLRIKHKVSHGGDFIIWNNNIDHINDSDEILIHRFSISFKFKDRSINFVNHENGSNSFSHGLSKHGFGLDTNTFNGIDNN